jgi:hypothetical protein
MSAKGRSAGGSLGPPAAGIEDLLSSELRNPAALTRSSCAERSGRPQSSLVAAGRGGLPQDPGASRPALYIAGRDVRLSPRLAPSRADAGGDLWPLRQEAIRCD